MFSSNHAKFHAFITKSEQFSTFLVVNSCTNKLGNVKPEELFALTIGNRE